MPAAVRRRDRGLLVWAASGCDKNTLHRFFSLLGEERCKRIELVSADGAPWIEEVVADHCPNVSVCLDEGVRLPV